MVTDARFYFSQSPPFSFSNLLTDASCAFLRIFCTVPFWEEEQGALRVAMGSPTLAARVEREKGLRLVSARCPLVVPGPPGGRPQTPRRGVEFVSGRACTVFRRSASVSCRCSLFLHMTHVLRLSETFVVLSTWFLDSNDLCISNTDLCVTNFWCLQ